MRWLVLALLAGCAQKISLISDPVGAQVRMGSREVGSTPVDVVVWSVPFQHPKARLTFPGYRAMEVDLGPDREPLKRTWDLLSLHWKRAFALVPAGSHEVLLVRRHGPAGSWTSEEAGE